MFILNKNHLGINIQTYGKEVVDFTTKLSPDRLRGKVYDFFFFA